VLLSCREGRAKLVTFAHLTHFPTLTNVTRRDNTWPDLQADRVEAGGRGSTKQPDLPVRESSSTIFSQKFQTSFFRTVCQLTFVPFKVPVTASNDASAEEGSMTRDPDSSQVETV
jgi:hypothetical protein